MDLNNQTAIVSGYGWNEVSVQKNPKTNDTIEIGSSSGLLFWATVSFSNDCHENIYGNIICGKMQQLSQKIHSGNCLGDGGNPLVLNKKIIVGILSSSLTGCDESRVPGVYTKVYEYDYFVENARNGIETSDMLVKTIDYSIFHIPTLKMKVATKSPRLQALLHHLQLYHPKYVTLSQELTSLKVSLDRLEATQKNRKEYVFQFNEYHAKNIKVSMLKKSIDDALKRLNDLKDTSFNMSLYNV